MSSELPHVVVISHNDTPDVVEFFVKCADGVTPFVFPSLSAAQSVIDNLPQQVIHIDLKRFNITAIPYHRSSIPN